MSKITIIKIGGKLIENPDSLSLLCHQLYPFYPHAIIVHGGGILANELAATMNIPIKMHEGKRITDEAMLKIAIMVYAGIANKNLVAALQQQGIDACGLSGCDMNMITAHKRPIDNIDWGYVGDIEKVNTDKLSLLLHHHIMPVISPITCSKNGELLNTNADSVAAAVAIAMSTLYTTELIYCFDKPGVLLNSDDDSTCISTISKLTYSKLKSEQKVHSGIIPKLDNAFKTIDAGVRTVRLTNIYNLAKGTIIQ